MTKRLLSSHAELIGGTMVEPGAEFDESEADEVTLKRLEKEGKVRDAKAPSKPAAKSEGKS